jgi:hypothetical protein
MCSSIREAGASPEIDLYLQIVTQRRIATRYPVPRSTADEYEHHRFWTKMFNDRAVRA